ncbi:hypothetical protein [Bacillus subtilis]|uniref:hypothetical protein n=1 Tax=Bacillus subtilis TaxID=1423 RepID=UPI0013F66801|nr:hypothetical protein [Bacillus subtilis]MCS4323966.1 hypothetical protein [Bacillus subtilis]NQE96739.1 hypothetical protein [Bacillus subtilis]
MGRQVKCPYCKTKLDKDSAIPYKKRYYHEKCFNTWKQETDHRKELIQYICNLYGLTSPTGMMLKQIKEYQEEYGYKLKGIELALRYFYETLDNQPREGDGIGIVPFVYDEAKRHYIRQKAIRKSAEDPKNHKREEITLVIKKGMRKKRGLVDISTL